MHIIPHLTQHSPSSIRRVRLSSRLGLVESWPRAAQIWNRPELNSQRILQIILRIRCAVAGLDVVLGQPFPGRELFVVFDRCFEE